MTIHSLPYEIPYCSSWEEEHSPEELVAYSPGNRSGLEDDSIDFDETDELPNSSKVKGWQTPKCPNYPQDLIVHLLCGPARIAKVQILSHHYKIATKIDVYVGVAKEPADVPVEFEEPLGDDDDDMVVEFTRLGYVCLDSNTRAQFRARELKSIKVNADGEYVRLVIRNCHQNRLNTYNQVGILALNILGQPLHPNSTSLSAIPSHMARHLHHPLDESSLLSTSTRRTSVSSSQSLVNRITASGAVEIELQQWISAIAHAEEDAVKGESYQLAKSFKELSDKLSRFATIVYDLEVGKKQAADAKDYDEAERIKADICIIKQKAEMLLKEAGVRVTRDGQVVALGSEDYDDFVIDNQSRILPDSLTYNEHDSRDRYEPEDSTLVSNLEQQLNVESVEEQQDRLYDEAIEKWTNFDAQHAVPSAEEGEMGLVQNDSMLSHQSTSSPRSSVSTDAAEMLLPPHLTSYAHNNSSPLLGRDMANDKDFRRESLASMLAPSLSSSVARKHSLRGSVHSIPAIIEEEPKREPQVDPEAEPETLIDAERHNCRLPIKIFGEEVVACILSVKVKCRERGLDHLCGAVEAACNLARENRLEQIGDIMEDSNLSDDVSYDDEYDNDDDKCVLFVKATLMMIQEAIMDSREIIIDKTIEIWENLNAFCDDAVPQSSIYTAIERAFSGLLMRTNDSNLRIRQAAVQLVITLSKKFAKAPHSLLSLYVCKPDRVIHNHKDARARIDLVTSVIAELLVEKSEGSDGLVPAKDLADFCATYLKHSHEDVRKAATDLVIAASKQVGYPAIGKYFDKALRQSISSTVKAAMEESSGKPNGKPASNGAVAELRALAAQANVPSEKKTTTTARKTGTDNTKRKPATTRTTGRTATGTARKTTTTTTGTRTTSARSAASATTANSNRNTAATASKAAEKSETAEPVSSDPKNACIFCEEVNPNFNEDTLVSHYYDDCPILTSCPRCQTILEVSTLNEHAFTDCAKRHLVKQCTRCKQPIPVEQWLQHSLKKNCTAVTDPKETRCPFCLANIDPPTEAGWKAHLLSGSGCPKNPRKPKKSAAATPASQDTNTATRKAANTSNRSSLRKKK